MPTSPRESAIGLPTLRVSSSASSSRCSSTVSASRRSSRTRSPGATADHAGNAARARATAASASSTPARSSVAIVRSVAGLTTVRVPLPTLEQSLALVAGDDAVEELLLGARVVEVVVDDVVAERRPRDLALLERGDRLAQRRREALRVGHVGVPLERRRRIEHLLDPVQARREQRREREVRVDVAAGNACLDAQRRPAADDPEAAGAVVP